MDISDYIFDGAARNDVEIASKEDAIDMLVSLHKSAGNIENEESFRREVLRRESELSTALENGVAIPHAKGETVKRPALAKITLKTPLIWGEKTVSTVYMLASPDDASHLRLLSSLADSLQNGEDNV